ncbi:MAG: zinc ribbon domain-containing protein [Dethiobacteria bacterium]|jgi:hypothetical protein
MFCEKCGSKLPENAKFCGSCGAKTVPVEPAVATPVHDQPAPPPPPPAQSAAQSYTPPAQPATQGYTPPAQAAAQSYTPPAQPATQGYTPPVQAAAHFGQVESEPLSVGNYIVMFLLMSIPLLNIILLFVWGFGSSVNRNRKNFARATLIMFAIMLLFWILAGGMIMGALKSIMGGF